MAADGSSQSSNDELMAKKLSTYSVSELDSTPLIAMPSSAYENQKIHLYPQIKTPRFRITYKSIPFADEY